MSWAERIKLRSGDQDSPDMDILGDSIRKKDFSQNPHVSQAIPSLGRARLIQFFYFL